MTKYEVRIIQEIPYADFYDDGELLYTEGTYFPN